MGETFKRLGLNINSQNIPEIKDVYEDYYEDLPTTGISIKPEEIKDREIQDKTEKTAVRNEITHSTGEMISCKTVYPSAKNIKLQLSPVWLKGYMDDKVSSLETTILSTNTGTDTIGGISGGKKYLPVNVSSIEKRLEESFSRDHIINESRTEWRKDGIKTREKLYSQGLVETVTNHEKAGIKQRRITDLTEQFHFSHIIKDNTVESKVINYNDIYIEESTNYETGSSVWKYRGKDKFIVHCSLATEEGKVKYTTFNEDNGSSRMALTFEDGRRHFEIEDLYRGRRSKLLAFPDNTLQLEYNNSEVSRKTIIKPDGEGIDVKSDTKGNLQTVIWAQDNSINYTKEYEDGTINNCYYSQDRVIQKASYPGGNSYELTELPGGDLKKVYYHKDGTTEDVNFFKEGETRRTVLYPDRSILVENSYPDESYKLGMKYSDGTSYLCKSWSEGVNQQCFSWPKAGIARMATEHEKEGIVERKTIYRDGSFKTEIESETGQTAYMTPGDPELKNIYYRPLRNIAYSPDELAKFMENPFHNPSITKDPQLWARLLLFKPEEVKSV